MAPISRTRNTPTTAIQNALSQDVHSPMQEWNVHRDRLQVIFVRPYINGADPACQTSASNPVTDPNLTPKPHSTNSRLSTSTNLASTPSLTNKETSAESTCQSVKTTAIQDRRVLVRDNGDDAFRRATIATNPLLFPCIFSFLKCTESFADEEEWTTHCLSHFHPEPPPKAVLCPFCHDFDQKLDDRYAAWNARMHHIASHYRAGHALLQSRPDFDLFRYLWQRDIISYADYRELEGNYYLQREPEAYVVTTYQEKRNERGTTRLRP